MTRSQSVTDADLRRPSGVTSIRKSPTFGCAHDAAIESALFATWATMSSVRVVRKRKAEAMPDENDELRVLRRALHIAIVVLYDEKLHVPLAADPQNYIRQARREIESEKVEKR
jgi:hypothetical protein